MSARKFNIHKQGNYGNIKIQFDIDDTGEHVIKVLLHSNLIMVIFGTSREFLMHDCGWQTVTTMRALNTALGQFNRDMKVKARKGQWYYVNTVTGDEVIYQNAREYSF